MKKISMLLAVAAIAVSANAEKKYAIVANKALDNTYIGFNVGIATPMLGDNSFSKTPVTMGLRLGKNFTTVFGLALNVDATMKDDLFVSPVGAYAGSKNYTTFNHFDVNLLGTANLMNAFAGYKGTPRFFEISALGGWGWGHGCGNVISNYVVSKVGLDFAFNLGKDKAWQVYIEPMLDYYLEAYYKTVDGSDVTPAQETKGGDYRHKYNLRNSMFNVKVGFNYKFKTSNGTHNFAFAQLRDQSEIDALNSQINGLRNDVDGLKNENASKDAKIADLKKSLSDCEKNVKTVVASDGTTKVVSNSSKGLTLVFYGLGKAVVTPSEQQKVAIAAQAMKNKPEMKVEVRGYASPEGNPEFNKRLAMNRAEAVKTMLVKKYGISADRIVTVGVSEAEGNWDAYEFARTAELYIIK